MNIIVCVKQVPDPDTPASAFAVNPRTNKVIPAPNMPPVIGPYDLNAVELALRLKEQVGGKVTALCLGTGLVSDVVKKPLAMGADELVLVDDVSLVEGADSYATAVTLVAAIKKIGSCDLIMTGRQAGDWDAGQVGCGIAELLGLPLITLVKAMSTVENRIQGQRALPDGHEVFEVPVPAVLTVTSNGNEPRYPTMRGIMQASRKQPTVWKAADIGLAQGGAALARTKLVRLFIPVVQARCEFVEGDTGEEAAIKLAQRLREVQLI